MKSRPAWDGGEYVLCLCRQIFLLCPLIIMNFNSSNDISIHLCIYWASCMVALLLILTETRVHRNEMELFL